MGDILNFPITESPTKEEWEALGKDALEQLIHKDEALRGVIISAVYDDGSGHAIIDGGLSLMHALGGLGGG